MLQDLRAESYVGVTLWSHAGQPIGLIAVIGRSPLANRPLAEAILKLVAVRAAGELERLDAEKALRSLSLRQEALLAAVPEIIMEVDNDKVYSWANQAGLDFFGEDVIGKEAAFYFEGEQNVYGEVQPLFDGDERIINVESLQRQKDGQKRLLAWWCRTLKDKEGNVIGALSTGRDITERKRAEKELAQSHALLSNLARLVPGVIY